MYAGSSLNVASCYTLYIFSEELEKENTKKEKTTHLPYILMVDI